MRTRVFVSTALLISLAIFAVACGAGGDSASGGEVAAQKRASDNLNVIISSPEGKLKVGDQDFILAFTDKDGNPVDISAAAINFNMPAMGSMAEMNDAATLATTSTPGTFTGTVNLQMAGEWTAQISYEGTESGKVTLPVTAY